MNTDLGRIIRTYPEWDIAREGRVWTATRRPTPTALHFIYAVTLDQLAAKLRREAALAQVSATDTGPPCPAHAG